MSRRNAARRSMKRSKQTFPHRRLTTAGHASLWERGLELSCGTIGTRRHLISYSCLWPARCLPRGWLHPDRSYRSRSKPVENRGCWTRYSSRVTHRRQARSHIHWTTRQ
jgi:hypothetical protein